MKMTFMRESKGAPVYVTNLDCTVQDLSNLTVDSQQGRVDTGVRVNNRNFGSARRT